MFSALNRAGSSFAANRIEIAIIAILGLATWLVFNWTATLLRIAHFYTPLWVWDYWRVAQDLDAYRRFDLSVFWKQHNEHRIVFPEVLFAIDVLLLHGRKLLPLFVSIACYIGTWIVMARALFSDRNTPSFIKTIATLLAGIVAGYAGSAFVLATAFLVQWTLMQFAAVMALLLICRLKESGKTTYLAGAIAASVIANYTSGNCLFFWPILIAAALLLRLDKRHVWVVVGSAIASTGLYFVGYRFSNRLNLKLFLQHPLYSLDFVASYMSMPFGGLHNPKYGVVIGLLSMAVAVTLFVIAIRGKLISSPCAIVLFGCYCLTLVTALLTAAGRMDLHDPTFHEAKGERFETVPQMTWAVFILLCFWVSARRRWKVLSPNLIALGFAIALAVGFAKLQSWKNTQTIFFSRAQLEAISLMNGVDDPKLVLPIFRSPAFIDVFLPKLQEQHLSIYSEPYINWLGRPAAAFGPVINGSQQGKITYTYPVKAGVEVIGWTYDSNKRKSSSSILLVSEAGQIVGVGKTLSTQLPDGFYPANTPPSLAWIGFVSRRFGNGSLIAYVIRKRGLEKLLGYTPMPAIQVASIGSVGPVIPNIQWQMNGIWKRNGFPPDLDAGSAPATVLYGSWNKTRDQSTGRIASSVFGAPAKDCIIVPVLHGPAVTGLSVQVVNAEDDDVVANAPMLAADTRWNFWRIPLGSGVNRLRIIATDEGRNWGEWLGVAGPSECK